MMVKTATMLALCLLSAPLIRIIEPHTERLLGGFEAGWDHHWMERKLAPRPTRFTVVEDSGQRVLMAESDRSASGLWRMLMLHPRPGDTLSWRWRVKESLTSNRSERSRKGDDYAARVFVVFEPHFLSWKTRALCYVWASHEAPGSLYDSPHAKTVKTIVLQSGNAKAREWVREERDLVSDYRRAFGSEPALISAVALMVDTDDTGLKAQAWFDDLELHVRSPEDLRDGYVKSSCCWKRETVWWSMSPARGGGDDR
jgi:DUF3047 family protein